MNKRLREKDAGGTAEDFDMKMRKLRALNKINVEILARLPVEQTGEDKLTAKMFRVDSVAFKSGKLAIFQHTSESSIEIG